MNPQTKQIGVYGLAVMGANLARNFASKGIEVVVGNRTQSVTEEFLSQYGTESLVGSKDLVEMVAKLAKPRKLMLMVKAGDAVDAVLEQLWPLLDSGDIVIDGGNSHFSDTIRRTELATQRGIHYVGCGVSGGEEGALTGACLMPGGSSEAWEALAPMFTKISATDFGGLPCVSHIGTDGAGHFVKMVHNGIEYAIMQYLAEVYWLLKYSLDWDNSDISDLFTDLNSGPLESYLLEISAIVAKKKEGADYLVEKILDVAGDKGTGRWTSTSAIDLSVSVNTISAALNARFVSQQKQLRMHIEKEYKNPAETLPAVDKKDFTEIIRRSLLTAITVAYVQGFRLLKTAKEKYDWQLNFAEIARIWQGGCIIRSKQLVDFQAAFADMDELLYTKVVQSQIEEGLPALREIVKLGVISKAPLPGLSGALTYLDELSAGRGSAHFIQGLRDCFGAHTYELLDSPGTARHTDWLAE